MRLLVAGDIHGDYTQSRSLFENAYAEKADAIVQLGDMGYWTHTTNGKYFLHTLKELHKFFNIPFYFIDGNHEYHPGLIEAIRSNERTAENFIVIKKGIFYIPRGTNWTWDDVGFYGVGGAVSVDQYWRHVGTSWWPQEQIFDKDLPELEASAKPAPIWFSHDVPNEVDIERIINPNPDAPLFWPTELIAKSNLHRGRLSRLFNIVQPKIVLHGHYHRRYNKIVECGWGEVEFIGLHCEAQPDKNWIILETDDYKT